MFKKFLKGATVIGIAAALPLSTAVVANAAPVTPTANVQAVSSANIAIPLYAPEPTKAKKAPTVKLKKIANSTVSKKSHAKTVKPTYTKSKGVKIKSAKVTVKNSKGKTIAKNRNSVKLKPGTYKLQNVVKYSYKKGKKTVHKTAKFNQSYKVIVKKAKAKKKFVAPKVTINKIGNKTVASKNSTVNIKPTFKKDKAAKISSAKVSVLNSKGKTISANKNNVKLKPGTYTVKSNVKFTYKNGKKTIKKAAAKSEKINIKAKNVVKTPTGAAYDNSAINELNKLRAKKGLPNLKTTVNLTGPNNAWTQSNFNSSRSVRLADGMTTLATFEVRLVGGDSVSRFINEVTRNKHFTNQLYSKSYTHIAVSNKNLPGEKIVGVSLAAF